MSASLVGQFSRYALSAAATDGTDDKSHEFAGFHRQAMYMSYYYSIRGPGRQKVAVPWVAGYWRIQGHASTTHPGKTSYYSVVIITCDFNVSGSRICSSSVLS